MAKKGDERLELLEQEILEMQTEFKKLPAMEENLTLISKNFENMNATIEK